MTALGASLMVLGVAFLFSGLIFVFPKPAGRKQAGSTVRTAEIIQGKSGEDRYYLQQIREERGEL
jgi:hypothetical protein